VSHGGGGSTLDELITQAGFLEGRFRHAIHVEREVVRASRCWVGSAYRVCALAFARTAFSTLLP